MGDDERRFIILDGVEHIIPGDKAHVQTLEFQNSELLVYTLKGRDGVHELRVKNEAANQAKHGIDFVDAEAL